MILTFTDFGWQGPYLGQVECVLRTQAPGIPVVHLMNDAPMQRPDLAAPLLAALARKMPPAVVCLCVVDPGVGSDRKALALNADGRWFVGPDNGLMNGVAAQAEQSQWYEITWRPVVLSSSFHGRDLFAPVVAALAMSDTAKLRPIDSPAVTGWQDDLHRIIYIDHFGNLMTGIRCRKEYQGRQLTCAGNTANQANTFSDVPKGELFWYENSLGLVELAVNQGVANLRFNAKPGVEIISFKQAFE